MNIMGNQRVFIQKVKEIVNDHLFSGCRPNHRIGDSRNFGDHGRDGPFRVDQVDKSIRNHSIFKTDCSYLYDPVVQWIQASGLKIKRCKTG
jgi:hypothetical protein